MSTMDAAKSAGLTAAKKAAGNARKLAELLGITPAAISRWGNEIPLSRVIEVEGVTGVPRAVLRPDVFQMRRPAKRKAA